MIWGALFIGLFVAIFVSRAMRPGTTKIIDKLSEIETNTKPTDERVVELEKTCPRCAEVVKSAASTCRFCNHEFDPASIVLPVSVVILAEGTKRAHLPVLLGQAGLVRDIKEGLRFADSLPCILVRRTSPQRANEIKALLEGKAVKLEIMDEAAAEALISARN